MKIKVYIRGKYLDKYTPHQLVLRALNQYLIVSKKRDHHLSKKLYLKESLVKI